MSLSAIEPSRAPSAYDPRIQEAGVPQDVIARDLSEVGEAVDFQGTLIRTSDHGLLLDNARVLVKVPTLRVPLHLNVLWDETEQKFVYQNTAKGDTSGEISDFLVSNLKVSRVGYESQKEQDEQEVTRDVFARWANTPFWFMSREFENRRVGYFRQRSWDKEAEAWNDTLVETFQSGFRSHIEQGLFMNRMLTIAKHHGLIGMNSFQMSTVLNHQKTKRGREPLPVFTTEVIKGSATRRSPMLRFRARTFSGSSRQFNFHYDGNRIFIQFDTSESSWIYLV